MSEEKSVSPLEAAEARREARKAKAAEARDAQAAIDTDAISLIEESLGDALVKAIDIPHLAGMVAKVAVRCPNGAETKRYRDQVKVRRDGSPGDPVAAHELMGEACRVYPDEKAFEALCEKLPSLKGQAGVLAVALSGGEAERAGKF